MKKRHVVQLVSVVVCLIGLSLCTLGVVHAGGNMGCRPVKTQDGHAVECTEIQLSWQVFVHKYTNQDNEVKEIVTISAPNEDDLSDGIFAASGLCGRTYKLGKNLSPKWWDSDNYWYVKTSGDATGCYDKIKR